MSPAHARDDFRHMWGADWIDALSRYDGLRAVRLTPLGAYAGRFTTTYVAAAPASPDRTLQVLANHDIVATADPAPADRLVLDAFAARTSDRVWTVSTASLLAAVDAGRAPGELGSFLDERAVHAVPVTVRRLLADVEARAGQVRDLGTRRVLECAEPSVATLLAQDRSMRGLCTRLGERHRRGRPGRWGPPTPSWTGRPLTCKGILRLADARDLVGDPVAVMAGLTAVTDVACEHAVAAAHRQLGGPHDGLVLYWLAERSEIDPSTIEPVRFIAGLVDILVVALDAGGPKETVDVFSDPEQDQQLEPLNGIWRLDHPRLPDVLEAIGGHHPVKAVAKAARKALVQHRSRTASAPGR